MKTTFVFGAVVLVALFAGAACGANDGEPSSSPAATPEPTLKAVSRSSPNPEEAIALRACGILDGENGLGRGIGVVSRMAKVPVSELRRYLSVGDAWATESTQLVYVITATGPLDFVLAGTVTRPLCLVVAGSPQADWLDLGDPRAPVPSSMQAIPPDRVLPTLSP